MKRICMMTCVTALIMGYLHGHCQELSKSARETLQNQYYEKCLDLKITQNKDDAYWFFINRINIDKIDELKSAGVDLQKNASMSSIYERSMTDWSLFGDVIIIGTITGCENLNNSSSEMFHSVYTVQIKETLGGNEYVKKHELKEVSFMLMSGSLDNGKYTSNSLEPSLYIGEEMLFFLARNGVGRLIDLYEKYKAKNVILEKVNFDLTNPKLFLLRKAYKVKKDKIYDDDNRKYLNEKKICKKIRKIKTINDSNNPYFGEY